MPGPLVGEGRTPGLEALALMNEALAQARQKAQVALSQARVTTDPDTTRWQQTADEWIARLITLTGDEMPPEPIVSPFDGKWPHS